MATAVIWDPTDPRERVLQILPSVNTPDYEGQPNTIINPDMTLVTLELPYVRRDVGDIVRDMTPLEISAHDAQVAADAAVLEKTQGKAFIDKTVSREGVAILMRALTDIIKDEINILRQWDVDLQAATAASNNLNDFKTNIAALPTLNPRTLAQLRSAIKARIDSGQVDT